MATGIKKFNCDLETIQEIDVCVVIDNSQKVSKNIIKSYYNVGGSLNTLKQGNIVPYVYFNSLIPRKDEENYRLNLNYRIYNEISSINHKYNRDQ